MGSVTEAESRDDLSLRDSVPGGESISEPGPKSLWIEETVSCSEGDPSRWADLPQVSRGHSDLSDLQRRLRV